jgi:RNA-splicing ligase RtcB
MGFTPGKWFKSAIEWANQNRDKYSEENLYNEIQNRFVPLPPKTMEPRDEPINFHCNIEIDPNNEAEVNNMFAVTRAMHNILVAPTAINAAVMPDACPTGEFDIPVGGVVGILNGIVPSFHSADICCSVMLSNFGKADPKTILDAAHSKCHFGPGGRDDFGRELPEEFWSEIKSNNLLSSQKMQEYAKYHLGTLGDGNHFIFVGKLKSSDDTVMVTHYGSRGYGSNLFKKGMELSERFRQEICPNLHKNLAHIPMDTPEGKEYWEALQIVRQWTKYNHLFLHEEVASVSHSEMHDNYWNEHNFVFKYGEIVYHAKGATPLLDKFVPDSTNGLRLIPMNMRDGILIVRGEETETNLGFAPHGSGREYSRTEYTKKALENKSGHELFEEDTKGLDIRFYTGKMDITELPSAYKDANKVKEQIKKFDLGEIVDEVESYGCIMSGHSDKPWKKKKK